MAKGFTFAMAGLLLLIGLYASWNTFSSIWGLARTGQAMMAKPEPKPAPHGKPLIGLGAKLSPSLVILKDGKLVPFDSNRLSGVTYYALYYSASWCPPCHIFTPHVVDFYNAFKPKHPNFELIFVDLDTSEFKMQEYMQNDTMPWPAITYAQIQNPDIGVLKYGGDVLPSLVLVDVMGNVLASTVVNGGYHNPEKILDQIPQIVRD